MSTISNTLYGSKDHSYSRNDSGPIITEDVEDTQCLVRKKADQGCCTNSDSDVNALLNSDALEISTEGMAWLESEEDEKCKNESSQLNVDYQDTVFSRDQTSCLPSVWSNPGQMHEYLGIATMHLTKMNSDKNIDQMGRNVKSLQLENDRKTLQDEIIATLAKHGIELDEDQALSFEIDSDGYIHVDGIDDQKQLTIIENVLNTESDQDSDLHKASIGFKIRTQLAREAAVRAIEAGEEPSIEVRQMLMEGYLFEKNVSFEMLETMSDEEIETAGISTLALQEFYDLQKIQNVTTNGESGDEQGKDNGSLSVRFQNGTLLNPSEVLATKQSVSKLFDGVKTEHPNLSNKPSALLDSIEEYNRFWPDQHDMQITEFDITVSSKDGSIEVEDEYLEDGQSDVIQSWLGTDFSTMISSISDQLLLEHQAEHGDVEDYEHMVVYHVDLVSGISTEIVSEEADQAAQADIAVAIEQLTNNLVDYVHPNDGSNKNENQLDIPVQIEMGADGLLKMVDTDGLQSDENLQQFKNLLDMVNTVLDCNDEHDVDIAVEEISENIPEELVGVIGLAQTIRNSFLRLH